MLEPNQQNDVLEQDSRNVGCIRHNGLEHVSLLTEEVMRKLGQLPIQAELAEEVTCKKCNGTKAITKKIRGMVYECACPCAANY